MRVDALPSHSPSDMKLMLPGVGCRNGSEEQYSRRDSKSSQAVGSCPKAPQLDYVPSASRVSHPRVVPVRLHEAPVSKNGGITSVISSQGLHQEVPSFRWDCNITATVWPSAGWVPVSVLE